MASSGMPFSWQRDAALGSSAAGSGLGSAARVKPAVPSVDQLSKAFTHIVQIVEGTKDLHRDADLYDLLAATSKEDSYQQHYNQGVRTWVEIIIVHASTVVATLQRKRGVCYALLRL